MKLKSILFVALTALAFNTMADNTANNTDKTAKFNTEKQKIEARVDKEVTILQQFKSCVSSAQKQEDIKKCREQKRKSLEGLEKE